MKMIKNIVETRDEFDVFVCYRSSSSMFMFQISLWISMMMSDMMYVQMSRIYLTWQVSLFDILCVLWLRSSSTLRWVSFFHFQPTSCRRKEWNAVENFLHAKTIFHHQKTEKKVFLKCSKVEYVMRILTHNRINLFSFKTQQKKRIRHSETQQTHEQFNL